MKLIKYTLLSLLIIILLPCRGQMPVEGATSHDYHSKSFWHGNWGSSIVHKGIDIFADKGTNIFATVKGIVVSSGVINKGGNYVLILTPKLTMHYYAHLNEIKVKNNQFVTKKTIIGTVGNSGNDNEPHLHYEIKTLIPYIWQFDMREEQYFHKMFYINPIKYIENEKN